MLELKMASSTTPLILRIVSASVAIANRAGNIIREIMKKGELGIVEKVISIFFIIVRVSLLKSSSFFADLRGGQL